MIVVLGSNGMLGRYVLSYLTKQCHDVIGVNRGMFDVLMDDIEKLGRWVQQKTVVINCIGVIPQSGVSDQRKYILVNSVFPHQLSLFCKQAGAKLIHITTDCVFTGNDGRYSENAPHDANDIYGISKSAGEPAACTVIRTSIIGEDTTHRSLLQWVVDNKGGTINGYTNHQWNGVTCLQLAKYIEYIIGEKYYWNGVRHVHSPTSVSKYELLKYINDVYDLHIDIKPLQTRKIDKTLVGYDSEYTIPPLLEQIKELRSFSL